MQVTIVSLGSMSSGRDDHSFFSYYVREDNVPDAPSTVTITRINVKQPNRGEDDWYFGIGSKLELFDPTPHPEFNLLQVSHYNVLQRDETDETSHWEYQHLAKLPAGKNENVAIPVPNTPTTEENELLNRQYRFTITPSHGYLHAPVACIQALGIADEITGFSFRRATDWLLEEDCDATTFLNALSNKLGKSRHWLGQNNLISVHGTV